MLFEIAQRAKTLIDPFNLSSLNSVPSRSRSSLTFNFYDRFLIRESSFKLFLCISFLFILYDLKCQNVDQSVTYNIFMNYHPQGSHSVLGENLLIPDSYFTLKWIELCRCPFQVRILEHLPIHFLALRALAIRTYFCIGL